MCDWPFCLRTPELNPVLHRDPGWDALRRQRTACAQTPAETARTRLSHSAIRFQLANVRVTTSKIIDSRAPESRSRMINRPAPISGRVDLLT
jgi:hypothetical protein